MNRNPLTIRVVCYAGYRGEETPQRLFLGERKIEIVKVADRLLDPEHRYFKVCGDDGGIYILRYDVASDRWELTMFDSGTRDQPHLSST